MNTKRYRESRAGLIWLGCALLAAAGCGDDPAIPFGPVDEAVLQEPGPQDRVLEGAEEETRALRLAREARASDGEGTNEDWVKRQMELAEQDVLFPRWEARRTAAGKYEVTFTYTVVGIGDVVARRGFAWTADVVLMLVTPPREMQAEELVPRSSRVYQRRALERRPVELSPE
ncbi:MAG TPA: hypothetical protein P5567_10160 [Kiritimatiellia bacterium]|nr:hypothetical protein [Kiritimatiellia bacterium]HRZ12803.1 hypothetical protein [Kiritimatiellia bacterium]HSA18245.1 hypothetical protein [Kiritimatiellia bacterium]